MAWFTLVVLVIYFPVETWASLPHGLWSPFYIVDLIAMALLLWGAVRSLRARPERSPAILCAAYAWTVANGWRATFGRMYELLEGGTCLIEVRVQRVIAVRPVHAQLDIVTLTAGGFQNVANLMAEVTFHLKNNSAHAALFILSAP